MLKKPMIFSISLAMITVLTVVCIFYFKISFTALPTNFSVVLSNELTQNGERIVVDSITLTESDSPHVDGDKPKTSETDDKIEITESNAITSLLIQDVRIYKGGKISNNSKEYTLHMNLSDGGSLDLYVANEYIRIVPDEQDGSLYKVLDKENMLYQQVLSLYQK